MRPILLACLLLLAVAPSSAANFAATVPTDEPDAIPGDGICDHDPFTAGNQCSLRAAIQTANESAGPHTITVFNQTYTLSLAGAGEDDAGTGDLDILQDITIDGAGRTSTVVNGKGAKDRVFDVHPGARLRLVDLAVRGGKTAKEDFDPGSTSEVSGGCVRSRGTLELDMVLFVACASSDDGGCVSLLDGSASIEDTIFGTCRAKGEGGALDVGADAEATLARVTIGACKAALGGAIATRGPLSLTNVTLDRNKAKGGGGAVAALDAAAVTINSSTLSNNATRTLSRVLSARIDISNSIVWSKKGGDCDLSPVSGGGNLEGSTSCSFNVPGDQQNADPGLLALALWGGVVPTRAIGPLSPAVDRGLDASCAALDARNQDRIDLPGVPGDEICDVGAFEFGGINPPAATVAITGPAAGFLTDQESIEVVGTATDAASVTVNGVAAMLSGEDWTASVPLVAGTNVLTATATNPIGSGQARVSGTRDDETDPVVTILSPADGATLTSSPVTVVGTAVDSSSVTVTVNGVSATNFGVSGFSASVPLTPGSNTLTAVATDAAGHVGQAEITVSFEPPS
jgi:CSLREA domain-containing protein